MRESDWIVMGATIILCMINLVYMQLDRISKENSIKKKILACIPENKKKISCFATMFIFNLALALLLSQIYSENSAIFYIKRLCLVAILWPIAAIDYKKYVIPNKLLLLGLGYRVLILFFELFFERETMLSTVMMELIAAVALLVVCFIFLLIMKNSIGAGDIKLIFVMALFLNLTGLISAVMASLIVSFFISVTLLLTKKKTRKDAIPFGPSVLIGTYISIALMGC